MVSSIGPLIMAACGPARSAMKVVAAIALSLVVLERVRAEVVFSNLNTDPSTTNFTNGFSDFAQRFTTVSEGTGLYLDLNIFVAATEPSPQPYTVELWSVTGAGTSSTLNALLAPIGSGTVATTDLTAIISFGLTYGLTASTDYFVKLTTTGDAGWAGGPSSSTTLNSIFRYGVGQLNNTDSSFAGGMKADVVAVPGPAAYALALAGLACGGCARWRRRMLSHACLLLALVVVPSAAHAATFFTDDFTSSAANSNLAVPSGWTFGGSSSPAGVAQNNGQVTDPDSQTTVTPRTYISTVATDFNAVDFDYQLTFTVGGGGGNIAFFGIGSGQPNPDFYDEPAAAFFLRQFPSSFSSGQTGWTISSPTDPRNPSENTFPSSGTGDGTYRARLLKSGTTLLLGIDANYAGGPFAADFSVTKNLLTDLSFLNSTNSTLFFGTAGTDTTFDNLSVAAVPEPSTCLMALAGVACSGLSIWRRRRPRA